MASYEELLEENLKLKAELSAINLQKQTLVDKSTQTQGEDDFGRVLLASNLPQLASSCDAICIMFQQFGTVERVKILKKWGKALVQMSTHEEAEAAVRDQNCLKKMAKDIFVTFSNKIKTLRMPSESGMAEDEMIKDYTTSESDFQPPHQQQQSAKSYHNPYIEPPINLHSDSMYDSYGSTSRHNSDWNRIEHTSWDGMDSSYGSCCILVSNIPEELAKLDYLCTLFGCYGDVVSIKILSKKKDAALIQLRKPHQAALCKKHLDQLRILGNKLIVSFSKSATIRANPNDPYSKDFSGMPVHRFRKASVEDKLVKKLTNPTPILHIANISQDLNLEGLKDFIVSKGFTVRHIDECGKNSDMALVQFHTTEEALMALVKLHKKSPDGDESHKLVVSFSSMKPK